LPGEEFDCNRRFIGLDGAQRTTTVKRRSLKAELKL